MTSRELSDLEQHDARMENIRATFHREWPKMWKLISGMDKNISYGTAIHLAWLAYQRGAELTKS